MERQEIFGYGLDFSNLKKPSFPTGAFHSYDVQRLLAVANKGPAVIEEFISEIIPAGEMDLVMAIPAHTRFGVVLWDHVRSMIGAKIELAFADDRYVNSVPFVLVKRPLARRKRIEFSANNFFSRDELHTYLVRHSDLNVPNSDFNSRYTSLIGEDKLSWNISLGDYLSFAVVRLLEVLQEKNFRTHVIWCYLRDDRSPEWQLREYSWLIEPAQICTR
jgi:hypothetical protein